VANYLGIDRKTYSNYENENLIIPIKHLISLCKFFDISIDYVFGFSTLLIYKNYIWDNSLNSNRLKEFRKEKRLTQEKLAKMLNTTQANIANYEKGKNIIATPYLYAICKKYNISADYILGKVDSPKNLK